VSLEKRSENWRQTQRVVDIVSPDQDCAGVVPLVSPGQDCLSPNLVPTRSLSRMNAQLIEILQRDSTAIEEQSEEYCYTEDSSRNLDDTQAQDFNTWLSSNLWNCNNASSESVGERFGDVSGEFVFKRPWDVRPKRKIPSEHLSGRSSVSSCRSDFDCQLMASALVGGASAVVGRAMWRPLLGGNSIKRSKKSLENDGAGLRSIGCDDNRLCPGIIFCDYVQILYL